MTSSGHKVDMGGGGQGPHSNSKLVLSSSTPSLGRTPDVGFGVSEIRVGYIPHPTLVIMKQDW